METCPKCFKLADKGIVTLNDGSVTVWKSCYQCWNSYLVGNPISRVLWTIIQSGNQAGKQAQAKPIEEMLKESNGDMTAKIAARVVAYANILNKSDITVAEVIAHERDILAKQRRGGMSVVKLDEVRAERKAKDDEDNEEDGSNGESAT